MGDDSFSELVGRAERGDREATGELIRLYEPLIRREVRFELLDNRLRRVLDESDVCQSVAARFFVGLWAEKFDFQKPEDLAKLLKEMVHNRVVDHARRWTATKRDYRRNVEPDPDAPVDPAGPGATPSRIVADAEIVAECERRLSPGEREMLELRRQDTSWAEIGAAQGLSPDNARIKFGRAIKRISQELGLEN